jgi:large subunit ribosomal protein L23
MALFGKKKEEKKKEVTKTAPAKSSAKKEKATKADFSKNASSGDFAGILLGPRMTEKTVYMTEEGVYVFNINQRANKKEVAKAIEDKFKVKPVKVNVVGVKSKPKRSRKTGKKGRTSSGKKAYVYLKKGDTISFA